MTEFISRKYGNDGYEVIIKTDSHEHYKASEDFARRLIDHEKPKTNADRIRAMSDRELAEFLAKKFADMQAQNAFKEDTPPTATQLSVLSRTWYVAWMQWLRQPAEE